MTEETYLELREAGVDQFSVSLDFPDDRHDDFRGLPRPLRPLQDLIPRCARHGFDNIVLNTCITSENLGEINAMADKAREWGVNMCYSAYSARRTGCRDYFLNTPEQLATLNRELDRVEARRDAPTGSSTRRPRSKPRAATSRTAARPAARPGCDSWW